MKFFKKSLVSVLTVAIVLAGINYIPSVATNVEAVDTSDGYNLVWSDEFEGTKLDTNTWSYEIGNGDWGWGNGEVEYYTNREDNVKVSGGYLQIIAKRENYGGQQFTSGRIISKGKKYFKYGKMEARIKVENGNQSGVWPAYWMMGENMSQGVGWPNCGEIDIMEHANSNNYVGGCLHWNYEGINGSWDKHGSYGSGFQGAENAFGYFTDNENNGINGWHTYTLIWDENHMEWQLDGKTYLSQDITDNNAYCFQKPHFFLFNLAIGGTGSGFTNGQTAGPDFKTTTMYVDYLRVYQQEEETTTKYDGPTITVTQDAVAESTGAWDSWFGDIQDFDYARGTLTNNSNKASDGATVSASRMGGGERWGIQAFLEGLKYYPGNTYTYECTLESDKDKVVFVKVAGDGAEEISGEYVSLKAGVPYNYTAQVEIPSDYDGVLDLYFGVGRCNGDTLSNADGFTLKISNVSFVTTATIPDPDYVPPTTPPQTTTKTPTTTTQPTTGGKTDTTTLSAADQAKLLQFKKSGKAKVKIAQKKKSAKTVKVTLKKALKVSDGYQVRFYKTKKNAKKNKKAIAKVTYKKNKKTFKVKSKKLKNKKTLYIRVRGYIKIAGKKYYGKWSVTKKVKTK